ncbi:hypothetical protein EJ08DRAFT_699841 [Tothia fuscella]|uniref:Uncharacterized protein n=1 Tax=Tothia fuscella TaxID=1048955 RepID=A0A9P4NLK5_9PEZI|nr:hypothetical protein EJ08DRAFT_699841 [Tothia fuscella]
MAPNLKRKRTGASASQGKPKIPNPDANLMGVPTEIRMKILSYLLPHNRMGTRNGRYWVDMEGWKMLGSKCAKTWPAVSQVNRKIYTEGVYLLYENHTIKSSIEGAAELCQKVFLEDFSSEADSALALQLRNIRKLRLEIYYKLESHEMIMSEWQSEGPDQLPFALEYRRQKNRVNQFAQCLRDSKELKELEIVLYDRYYAECSGAESDDVNAVECSHRQKEKDKKEKMILELVQPFRSIRGLDAASFEVDDSIEAYPELNDQLDLISLRMCSEAPVTEPIPLIPMYRRLLEVYQGSTMFMSLQQDEDELAMHQAFLTTQDKKAWKAYDRGDLAGLEKAMRRLKNNLDFGQRLVSERIKKFDQDMKVQKATHRKQQTEAQHKST